MAPLKSFEDITIDNVLKVGMVYPSNWPQMSLKEKRGWLAREERIRNAKVVVTEVRDHLEIKKCRISLSV